MVYDNLFTLLDSMKAHRATHGYRLRCSDDPARRQVGFCTDEGPLTSWMIGLVAMKTALHFSGDPRVPLLRELLLTPEGRLRLVESINQGQPLV